MRPTAGRLSGALGAPRVLPEGLTRLRASASRLLAPAAFTTAYLAVVWGLGRLDLRTQYFDAHGWVYPVHHLLTAVFAGYMGWLAYALGAAVVDRVERRGGALGLGAVDGAVARFFVGLCAVHMAVFALGHVYLLYRGLAIALTAPVVLASWPRFAAAVAGGRALLRNLRPGQRLPETAAAVAVAVLAGYVFLKKVVYPTADWDTIMHYNPYFWQVVSDHHLYPNAVWYHYYYSKGAGSLFLGILLGGDYGHKVVTFVGLAASCLALYSLLHRATRSGVLSLAGIAGYLGACATGSWYLFDKQHILLSSLLVACVWAAARYYDLPENRRGAWAWFTSALVGVLILFSPTAFALVFPCFAVGVVGFLVARRRPAATHCGVVTGVAGATLAAVLGINFLVTGMLEINPMGPFYARADQDRMARWFSPYLILWFLEGFPPGLTGFSFRTGNLWEWLAKIWHLDTVGRLWPGPGVLFAVAGLFLACRRVRTPADLGRRLRVLIPVGTMAAVSFLVSLIADQPVSIVRLYIFTSPLIILVAGLTVAVVAEATLRPGRARVVAVVVAGYVIVQGFTAIRPNQAFGERLRADLLPFATGQSSTREAYTRLGIFCPNAYEARLQAGLNSRVLTFNPMHQSGTLPGRPLEVELNHGYPDWHHMAFGDADAARAAFSRHQIEYFLVDFDMPINGLLPVSPLFREPALTQHLRVAWTRDSTVLLTWRNPGDPVTEADRAFAARYHEQVRKITPLWRLHERLTLYYQRTGGGATPVRHDRTLPRVDGLY